MHFVHKNKIATGTACVVERDEDCRSIKKNPMVQTYDPWGLGSGQSERMTQIVHVAEGGIGYGLVDARISWVNRVLFENIYIT